MFVSHHLSGLIGIPGRGGGGREGIERCVLSCGPYLSAGAQGCPENSCAPTYPDPRVAAGTHRTEVTFSAVPVSLGTKQAYLSLLWACQIAKRMQQGPLALASYLSLIPRTPPGSPSPGETSRLPRTTSGASSVLPGPLVLLLSQHSGCGLLCVHLQNVTFQQNKTKPLPCPLL